MFLHHKLQKLHDAEASATVAVPNCYTSITWVLRKAVLNNLCLFQQEGNELREPMHPSGLLDSGYSAADLSPFLFTNCNNLQVGTPSLVPLLMRLFIVKGDRISPC